MEVLENGARNDILTTDMLNNLCHSKNYAMLLTGGDSKDHIITETTEERKIKRNISSTKHDMRAQNNTSQRRKGVSVH